MIRDNIYGKRVHWSRFKNIEMCNERLFRYTDLFCDPFDNWPILEMRKLLKARDRAHF